MVIIKTYYTYAKRKKSLTKKVTNTIVTSPVMDYVMDGELRVGEVQGEGAGVLQRLESIRKQVEGSLFQTFHFHCFH